jgi:DNA-binding GntR family transcriptional regulator
LHYPVRAHSPILAEFYRQLAPQIVAAIRARAAKRAVTAVRGHVRTVGDVRLLAWEPAADES